MIVDVLDFIGTGGQNGSLSFLARILPELKGEQRKYWYGLV